MVLKRFEWIMEYCTEIGTDEGVYLNCGRCSESRVSDSFKMLQHLYQKHQILEIDVSSERNSLNEKFTIEITSIVVGTCRKCETKVECALGQVFPLKNHLTMCHTDDETTNFFAKANGISSGQKILIKYEIKNTISAQCTYCDTPQHLEDLDSNTADVLMVLCRHWNTHHTHLLYRAVNKAIIQKELQEKEKTDLEVKRMMENIDKEIQIKNYEEYFREYENREDLEQLSQQYDIKILPNFLAKCYPCNRIIDFKNRCYLVRNHCEIFHGPKSCVYKDKIKLVQVQNLLNHYKIEDGTRAICSACDVFTADLKTETNDKLMELFKHWCEHSGTSQANKMDRKKQLQKLLSTPEGTSETGSSPRPSTSNDGEDVAGPSGIQNVTTQGSSTETSSKRKRKDSNKNSDSDN